MHEVPVKRLGGLSLPRKSVVRLTDRPDMTIDVYRGRKTTTQQQQQLTVVAATVRGWFAPPPPPSRKNAYRKDDYIVNCPDLIEPVFPHSHFSPIGIWSTRKFYVVNGGLRKGKNQNETEQRHFIE